MANVTTVSIRNNKMEENKKSKAPTDEELKKAKDLLADIISKDNKNNKPQGK